jgi:phosphoglycolate phosphatase-like HAD superfamily hydrolase
VNRRLVLFDIDGTLLSAGGVFRDAITTALRAAFLTEPPIAGYDFSGKTDPQIVRELMRAAGLPEGQIDQRMAAALEGYRAELAARLHPEHVRAKAGVHALVERLARDPRVTLGLLTGNLEPCARAKLEPLQLNPRFPFGAYGSDHEDRAALPALAVQRAHAATGHRFIGKSVVIVGDSVHDVRCGRGIGVRAVAVATGRTTPDALRAEAPDALLPDFTDTIAAAAAILGVRT